jgi:hypothetical protein
MAEEREGRTQRQPTTAPPKEAEQPHSAVRGKAKGHPVAESAGKYKESIQQIKARGTGETPHKRVATILRSFADACEDADKYVTERGTGFDDKPAKGAPYDEGAVKAMRFEMQTLLDQVRQDVQVTAPMIAAQRASRPAALSPELELILRQLASALLSTFFSGMRFENEEPDQEAAQIVTRPGPRTQPRAQPRVR